MSVEESGESYSSPPLGKSLPGEEGVTVIEVSVDVEAARSELVPLVRMASGWLLGLTDLPGSICLAPAGSASEMAVVCGGTLARGKRWPGTLTVMCCKLNIFPWVWFI